MNRNGKLSKARIKKDFREDRTLKYLIISSHRLTIILLCFHLVSLLSTLRRLTQLAMFLQQYTDTSPTCHKK